MTQRGILLERLGLVDRATSIESFAALFAKWNASINLSAARSPEEIDAHVRDSLHVVPYLGPTGTVVDVGSGGGLPVVVAAICRPDLGFVALEPVHKKHAFLRTAARELGLDNLEPRAERWERHERRGYDVAMSRATLELGAWIEVGLELVRPGGRVLGFEAVERVELEGLERHAYEIDGKQRAIVVVQRAS